MTDILQAHAEWVARAASVAPRRITVYPAAEDFRRRAGEVELVLASARNYLAAIVEEAAENAAGGFDRAELLGTIEAHLSDLSGDVTGALDQLAERLTDGLYDGCPRGAFGRRRSARQ